MSTTPRVLLAAGAAAALLLTGCSSSDTSSDDAAQAGTDSRGPITFAMGKNDAAIVLEAIDQWNAEHPDEQVTFAELAGEANDQRNALVQSLEAKSGDYDVMALDVVWTAEFAANGYVAPLEGDLEIDTSGLLPSTVDSATYQGELVAGPMNTNGALLFYRTDLVPQPPTTFAELRESCATLPAEVQCYAGQFKNYEGLTVNVSEAINAFGGAIVGEDGATPVVDSPEAAEALQTLVDMFADGQIPADGTTFTEEQTHLAFLAGEVAYARNWPYMYSKAETDETSQVKDKFAVAPLPGKDGVGASTLGGYNNAINVNSEHKATARDFIAFLQGEQTQRAFMEASFPPVLASVYDDTALEEQYAFLPTLKESLENAVPRPVTPFYEAISKAVADNAYAALRGEKSVEQALADMKAAIETAGR